MKNTYPTHSPQWWFDNYLPEPYRSEAIENFNAVFNESDAVDSLEDAISSGFNWMRTKQGQAYWQNLCSIAEQGEFSNPQP